MPNQRKLTQQVQRLLHRQHELLDELRSLAPKECADVDNEDWRLMFWRGRCWRLMTCARTIGGAGV